jgi:hypothetical protein
MELLPFLEMISLDGHSVAGASSLASSAIEEKLRLQVSPGVRFPAGYWLM